MTNFSKLINFIQEQMIELAPSYFESDFFMDIALREEQSGIVLGFYPYSMQKVRAINIVGINTEGVVSLIAVYLPKTNKLLPSGDFVSVCAKFTDKDDDIIIRAVNVRAELQIKQLLPLLKVLDSYGKVAK